MKIGTASTRRAIDRWKARARTKTVEFQSKGLTSLAQTIVSPKRGRVLLVLLLIAALSLNFAVVELSVLIVMGFFVMKLHFYRFINSMMKLMPF